MKLLLVEDHRELRDLVAEHFVGRGFVVDAVGAAKEARKALSIGGYDVLILDLGLPDLDGMTLLREICIEVILDGLADRAGGQAA